MYSESWKCNCCGKSHLLIVDNTGCSSEQSASRLFDDHAPNWLPDAVMANGTRVDLVGPCCVSRFDLVESDFVEQVNQGI